MTTFNQLQEKLNLSGGDLVLAALVWNTATQYTLENSVISDCAASPASTCNYFFDSFKEEESFELTREETQSLVSLFRNVLKGIEQDKDLLKCMVQEAWMMCDKNSIYAELYFKHLNDLRNDQRELKKQYNKLAEIQRKLKRKLSVM